MLRLRAFIADDEPLARKKIRALLEREPEVEILGECGSGPAAARLIRELEPNVVFLDIEMPELDGLAVMEGLGPRPPAVIFVTAYDQYAVRAFEVQALDYLLKPFDRRRFQTTLARAREYLRSSENGAAPISRLLVRAKDRLEVLKVEDIDWIEAADNYVKVHVLGKTHLVREPLRRLQSRLDPARFLRIHRSTLVNVERIRSLYPLFHGDQMVVLSDGTELPLSRRYRSRVESHLGRPSHP